MVLAVPRADGATSLIRWVFANNEDELVEFALEGQSAILSEPDLVFNNTSAKWVMFNAAANPTSHTCPIRSIELPLGPLRVETSY